MCWSVYRIWDNLVDAVGFAVDFAGECMSQTYDCSFPKFQGFGISLFNSWGYMYVYLIYNVIYYMPYPIYYILYLILISYILYLISYIAAGSRLGDRAAVHPTCADGTHTMVDVAPTVAALLGVPVPRHSQVLL